MRKSVEEKLVQELRTHISKVVDDIKGDVKKQIAGEAGKALQRETSGGHRRRRLVLAVALSVASVGLGIGIAALAGLIV
jgi:hypothetical protein